MAEFTLILCLTTDYVSHVNYVSQQKQSLSALCCTIPFACADTDILGNSKFHDLKAQEAQNYSLRRNKKCLSKSFKFYVFIFLLGLENISCLDLKGTNILLRNYKFEKNCTFIISQS